MRSSKIVFDHIGLVCRSPSRPRCNSVLIEIFSRKIIITSKIAHKHSKYIAERHAHTIHQTA